MPKYLVIASYNSEGIKGVLAKGGTARKQATESAVASVGGRVESFHFGFGSDDVYIVCDVPDNTSAAAVAMRAAASGMISTRTIPLVTPEEIDRAAKMDVRYGAPGS